MTTYLRPPRPYPIDAFLDLPRNLGYELVRNVQTSPGLTMMAVNGGMSYAAQGQPGLLLPTGQLVPPSQWFHAIAVSGERKTTLDNLVLGRAYLLDASATKSFAEAQAQHSADDLSWKTELRLLREQILKQSKDQKAVEDLQAQLASHLRCRPVKPRLRRGVIQNASERAVYERVQGEWGSIIYVRDEGGNAPGSMNWEQSPTSNKMWDCPPQLSIDRAGFENFVVCHPLVTVSRQSQPGILRASMANNEDAAHQSGHYSRYCWGWPESTIGFRESSNVTPTWDALAAFHARMEVLLLRHRAMLEAGDVARSPLQLSDAAARRWRDLNYEIEVRLRPGGYFSDIPHFAAKSMNTLGREACIFHWFDLEHEPSVSVDTLERAYAVVDWHMDEAKRIHGVTQCVPQEQVDVSSVLTFLWNKVWRGPRADSFIPKNFLLQYGPIRKRDRLDVVLHILEQCGAISIQVAVTTKKKLVVLNDHYFAPAQVPPGIVN